MNLQRLTYFLALVEHGTVTAAANALLMAQPALSRQIKVLERELKLDLFRMQGNRLALTPGGRTFVPVARRLLQEAQMTQRIAKQLSEGRLEQVVVAATAATLQGYLAPSIPQMPDDLPLILTRSVSHFDIYSALDNGADLVISPLPPERNLIRKPLHIAKIFASVAPDHPLAQRGSPISLGDLADLSIAMPTQNCVSRLELDNAMARAHRNYGKYYECDDDVTLLALAAAGRAVAISTLTTRTDLIALPIYSDESRNGFLAIRLHAAWHPSHFASTTLMSLSERLIRVHRPRRQNVLPSA